MKDAKPWRFFVFVVLMGTLGQLAAEVNIPSLPYIMHEFKARESLVQLSISYFLLGMASAGMFFGYMSDYVGRRKILFIAAIIGAFGTLVCILAPGIYWLIFGRLIQGVGFSGVSGIGRAILRDRLQGLEYAKYAAYLSIATSLAIDFAPFIGGFLQEYVGWRIVFVLVLGYTLSLIVMIYGYKETSIVRNLQDDNNKIQWSKFIVACVIVFKNQHFLRFGVVSAIVYAIFMMYLTIVPFIIQEVLHKSPIWFGIMIFILSILYAVFSFINGKLLGKFDITHLLQFGLWLTLLSAVLLFIISYFPLSAELFIIAIIPLFIGSAFVFSTSDALSFATIETNIGVASSLIISMRLIFGFIFTALISLSDAENTFSLGVWLFILTAIALFLVISYKKGKNTPLFT